VLLAEFSYSLVGRQADVSDGGMGEDHTGDKVEVHAQFGSVILHVLGPGAAGLNGHGGELRAADGVTQRLDVVHTRLLEFVHCHEAVLVQLHSDLSQVEPCQVGLPACRLEDEVGFEFSPIGQLHVQLSTFQLCNLLKLGAVHDFESVALGVEVPYLPYVVINGTP